MRSTVTHGPRLGAAESAAIGRNVRVLRRRRGWTLEQLAVLLGYAVSEMSRRENGKRRWRTGDLPVVADRLSVCMDELTGSCANCGGKPPSGFACLSCEATGRERA